MRRQAVRVLRLSFGIPLLALGAVGLFMPILQGWLFIIAGLSVMAPESPAAHRALAWIKTRVQGLKPSHERTVEGSSEGVERQRPSGQREQPADRLGNSDARASRVGVDTPKHENKGSRG